MNSLQARIVALLIAAMLSVAMLATYTATRVMRPPSPQATMEPVARQIHATVAMLGHNDARDAPPLRPNPAEGVPDEHMTHFLRGALSRTGPPFAAVVSRAEGQASLTASVPMGARGWLAVEIPDLSPPPGRWRVLVIWLLLLTIGSMAVAVYAARRLTRPLQLLEDAADRVGPDGRIAHIPEVGTGEVRAAAKALNRLSAQLRSAMESRMRLVAAAGHDLRTPMTRMRLRAEFIEDETERAKWLADLEELDQIADSAIRLVREEVRASDPEPLRLDQLLQVLVEELRELGQKIELGVLPVVTVGAGPMALKRAMRNLISNAATHGEGAEVSLTRQGDTAVIRILDSGPGIPEKLIGRVFEPFFRVDQARRKTFPGAGLGLAIAREIVERLGGTITIRNRERGGLEQLCALPVRS